MSIFKTAILGGDNTEEFEQSFASIAFQNIQKKAPKLMNYLLGFQLVDRNEDETKAIGVFGVQIDKQLIFLPVFFLSGDIKGQELMYLKNQDMFVPLKENWVNLVMRKRPQILGKGTKHTVQDMGVMQPNVSQVVLPPYMSAKYSSFMKQASAWVHDSGALPTLAKLSFDLDAADDVDNYVAGQDTGHAGLLERFIDRDARYVYALDRLCDAWPGVKQALAGHYGPNFLSNKLAACRAAKNTPAEPPTILKAKSTQPKTKCASVLPAKATEIVREKLAFITHNSPLLSAADKARLLRDGVIIADYRKEAEASSLYKTQKNIALTNPTETGVYEVLFRPGTFHKCLVIFGPYSGNGRHEYCTVVQLEDSDSDAGRPYVNVPANMLFIKSQLDLSQEKGDWFDNLPDNKPGVDGYYVAVSRNGQGSVAFELDEKQPQEQSFRAYFRCHCDSGSSEPVSGCVPSYESPAVVFGVRKGSSFYRQRNTLYIPEGAKVIEIRAPRECRKCDKTKDKCTCDYFDGAYKSLPELLYGGAEDLELALQAKTAELKLQADQCDIIIEGRRLSKKAALMSLVGEHGLREDVARDFLKQAEIDTVARRRICYAPGYPLRAKIAYGMGGFPEPTEGGTQYGMAQMPGMESYMGSDIPYVNAAVQTPMEQQMPVPGLEAGMNDPNVYNPMLMQDPMAAQMAQQSSEPGSKDIFDTAVLSALTKVVNPNNVVDDDLPVYAKALNKLGRRLFMFFWHNESFQERYGKKDLPELEDTLRNAFEMLGDLLLYLKQDSIDSLFGTSLSNIGPNIQATSRV